MTNKGKTLLLLTVILAVLTTIYIVAVVNAVVNSTNSEYHAIAACWAGEYVGEPDKWNTTEELGIVGITEYENGTLLFVGVGPKGNSTSAERVYILMREQPIFLYNDKFYKVFDIFVDIDTSTNGILLEIPTGIALTAGWIVTGLLFIKSRNKK